MEGIPVGFIFILLGVVAAGIVFTMLVYAWKQRKLQRLKDPHKELQTEVTAGIPVLLLFLSAGMPGGRFFSFLVHKSDCFM